MTHTLQQCSKGKHFWVSAVKDVTDMKCRPVPKRWPLYRCAVCAKRGYK